MVSLAPEDASDPQAGRSNVEVGKRVFVLASDRRLLSPKGNLGMAEHDVCCPLVWEDLARHPPPSQSRQQPPWTDIWA